MLWSMPCRQHITSHLVQLGSIRGTADQLRQAADSDRERLLPVLFTDVSESRRMEAEMMACPNCRKAWEDLQP